MCNVNLLLSTWLQVFTFDFLRYLLGAGLVFLALGLVLKNRLAHRKIQKNTAKRRQMIREFAYSVATVAAFATISVVFFFGPLKAYTKVYGDIESLGWAYAGVSLLLLFVLHDTYFYWSHRLMHHKALFRYFHRLHHLSYTPTPWAAYAFAPPEAMVHALFLPLVALWLPLHGLVIFVFLAVMILRNAMGHSGVEFHPQWFAKAPFGWFTTVTHHDMHHQNGKGNYGLYFTWWDRWMGTEHSGYQSIFRQITEQQRRCKEVAQA